MCRRFQELSIQSLELEERSAVLIRASEALREKCSVLRAQLTTVRIEQLQDPGRTGERLAHVNVTNRTDLL